MPLGTVGKYERLDVLGHGVSGIVYLAKDTLLNRQVALKEVDVQAGDVRRFLEEARVMDRLHHPNIVRVNGVERVDGKVLIDMEYVRGQNLQTVLRREGCLSLERALDVAAQVLDGLDYAHRMQTVHRDIKPANILVDRDGAVKLADFGLAEILATNAYAGGAGTYAYMAPEDFAEEAHSDHQSDLWAVGVTLFEALTATRPFAVQKVKDPFAWKRALESQTPARLAEYLPDAPLSLQAVLDRALARDKRLRYPDATAFRTDICQLRKGESPCSETWRVHRLVEAERDASEGGATVSGVSSSNRPKTPFASVNYDQTPGSSSSEFDLRPAARTPGMVVAEVVPHPPAVTPPAETPSRRPLLRRGHVEPRLTVEPGAVDFGEVRKGELRTVKVRVRTQGVSGMMVGRIIHNPGWLTVRPLTFDRPRQVLTVTAHTGRAWETGEFNETVRVETKAGTQEIPVRISILRSRQAFAQVALWYVPLFFLTVLPILGVALGMSPTASLHETARQIGHVVAPAATATAGLSLMLLLVAIAADLGMAERAACGVMTAAMCFVLGAILGSPAADYVLSPPRALLIGGMFGAFLLLQLLFARRWKLWGVALAALSLFSSAMILGGQGG